MFLIEVILKKKAFWWRFSISECWERRSVTWELGACINKKAGQVSFLTNGKETWFSLDDEFSPFDGFRCNIWAIRLATTVHTYEGNQVATSTSRVYHRINEVAAAHADNQKCSRIASQTSFCDSRVLWKENGSLVVKFIYLQIFRGGGNENEYMTICRRYPHNLHCRLLACRQSASI